MIWLARHGETAANAEGRVQGWLDPPLNERGRAQAESLVGLLLAFGATDLYAAGGVPVILKRLDEAGLLHRDQITVTGQTIGEVAEDAIEAPGQERTNQANENHEPPSPDYQLAGEKAKRTARQTGAAAPSVPVVAAA